MHSMDSYIVCRDVGTTGTVVGFINNAPLFGRSITLVTYTVWMQQQLLAEDMSSGHRPSRSFMSIRLDVEYGRVSHVMIRYGAFQF